MEELARSPQRELSIVTSEIRDLCRQARQMMLIYAAEIGRRLIEAKEIVPHGEWADYLNELGFKQRTAENHMQIFRAYGSEQISLFGAELKSQTFANISYSAALKLLAIPEEEREDFIKDNDIESKSTREIDALIKERNEAAKRAEAAEKAEEEARAEADRLRAAFDEAETRSKASAKRVVELSDAKVKLAQDVNELQSQLDAAKEKEKKNRKKIKELKDNPVISQKKLDELKAAAEKAAAEQSAAEIEKQLAELKAKLAAAEEAEIEAKRAAANASDEMEELKKALNKERAISDPAVVKFRETFNRLQNEIDKAKSELAEIKDKGIADKFKGALKQLAAAMAEA